MSEDKIDLTAEVIDFSNVPDIDEPMPAGIYGPCAVIEAEKKTSSSGNPMWVLTFNILDGPHTGRRLWHNMTLTPKALRFVRKTLKALGIDISKPVPLTPDLFMGRQALLRVDIEEWDGEPRNRIREILPAEAGKLTASSVF